MGPAEETRDDPGPVSLPPPVGVAVADDVEPVAPVPTVEEIPPVQVAPTSDLIELEDVAAAREALQETLSRVKGKTGKFARQVRQMAYGAMLELDSIEERIEGAGIPVKELTAAEGDAVSVGDETVAAGLFASLDQWLDG